jgi:structure-specific recognition protein 1
LTNTVAIREEIAKLDRLEKHYEKPTFEVVSSVFRALSKKKIVSAGSFQRQALFASS